jgi:hypothetical protein
MIYVTLRWWRTLEEELDTEQNENRNDLSDWVIEKSVFLRVSRRSYRTDRNTRYVRIRSEFSAQWSHEASLCIMGRPETTREASDFPARLAARKNLTAFWSGWQ